MEFKDTVTLVDSLVASVPLAGEASSQVEVLIKDQSSEFVPVLVNVKISLVTLNGPPAHPALVKLNHGVTNKGSGDLYRH